VLKDQLQKWFDEAAWHAPSVIFFDDFDRMIPAEVEVSLKQYRTNTSPPPSNLD
jgi:SpoVK/Ycf46/Vps4 family AAA+-type ATPase